MIVSVWKDFCLLEILALNYSLIWFQLKPCTILHMLWGRPSIRTLTFTGKISKTSTTSLVGSQLTSSSLALTKRSQERKLLLNIEKCFFFGASSHSSFFFFAQEEHGRSVWKQLSFYTPGTIQSSSRHQCVWSRVQHSPPGADMTIYLPFTEKDK